MFSLDLWRENWERLSTQVMQHRLPLLHPAPLKPRPLVLQWEGNGAQQMNPGTCLIFLLRFWFNIFTHLYLHPRAGHKTKHCSWSSEHLFKLPSPLVEREFQGEKKFKLKISQGQYRVVFLYSFSSNDRLISWESTHMDQPPHCWRQFSYTNKKLSGHT